MPLSWQRNYFDGTFIVPLLLVCKPWCVNPGDGEEKEQEAALLWFS